jgi:hypothetical protein
MMSRMAPSTPVATPAPVTADIENLVAYGPPLPRQCGRCRSMFAGDRSLDPPDAASSKWWACHPCRTALFGNDLASRRSAWSQGFLTPAHAKTDGARR